jgi:copper chaperone CopZ
MNALTRWIFAICLIGLIAGCGTQASDASSSASIGAARAAFNTLGAPTVEFSLPDMMCEDGCAMAVEDILARQPGAKEVRVDFKAKTATVAIEEGKFDSEQALAALVDKGFDHSQLADEAAAADAEPQAAN